MTAQGKEYFCQLLASLFYSPDQELVKQIQRGTLHSFFEKTIQSWGEGENLLNGFFVEEELHNLLSDLKDGYDRLFSEAGEKGVSLVESFYKPWSRDPHCPLPFASERGLLMGDPALHLLTIYQQCGLEVGNEFKGRPDHIVMELEFLSYLYRWAGEREVKKFIEDHLDWIPLLKEELKHFYCHPFYVSVLEILDLFLKKEKERLGEKGSEKKSIH